MIKAPELNTISFKCGTKNIIVICTFVIVAYLIVLVIVFDQCCPIPMIHLNTHTAPTTGTL